MPAAPGLSGHPVAAARARRRGARHGPALGLPALLGPAGRHRDLALALIISRVVAPASKLATTPWWDDTTLGADLAVAGASTDEVYAAMDWLPDARTPSRRGWPARHLTATGEPVPDGAVRPVLAPG